MHGGALSAAPFTPIADKPTGLIISVFCVISAIAGLGIWSMISRTLSYRRVQQEAKNLFLKISYLSNEQQETGFLRSLDLVSASMVSKDSLKKGDQILLKMGSLPNFPGSLDMSAEIVESKPVKGDEVSRLINMKFNVQRSPLEGPLGSYLEQLSQ